MSSASSDARQSRAEGMHPSRIIALTVGAIYTLIGIAGFFVTGFDQFAGVTNETLLGFEINPLHNIVHLGIGLLGLAMSGTIRSARSYGWLLAAVYGLTFLYGLFAVGNDDLNFLSLNAADNWLHAASVVVGLAAALWPATDRERSNRTATA